MKNDDHIVVDNEIPNNICEECKNEEESVRQNLILHRYKLCSSCWLSKNIFPIEIPLKRIKTNNKKKA